MLRKERRVERAREFFLKKKSFEGGKEKGIHQETYKEERRGKVAQARATEKGRWREKEEQKNECVQER